MSFHASQVLPDVWQIADPMGVCCTLLVGREQALLVDTGYGLDDLPTFVRTLTDRPLRVLLTHGHHDHALGAKDFPEVWLFPEDRPVYDTYTREPWRGRATDSARRNGIALDRDAFLAAAMPDTLPPPETVELGGLIPRIMRCPGHTPGSAVVWVPERALLLTGDDWNPVTWCFFKEALPVWAYRENVRKLAALPFQNVLCSHRESLWSREDFTSFIDGLTDERIREAEPSEEGAEQGIDTVTAHPAPGQILVFDRAKAGL